MQLTAVEKLMYEVMKAIYDSGIVRKPPFDEVYESVKAYIKDEIPNRKPKDLE